MQSVSLYRSFAHRSIDSIGPQETRTKDSANNWVQHKTVVKETCLLSIMQSKQFVLQLML